MDALTKGIRQVRSTVQPIHFLVHQKGISMTVLFNLPVTLDNIAYVLSTEAIPLEIDWSLSLKDLARECGLKKINKHITDENFPELHGVLSAEYSVMYFANIELSGKKITDLIRKIGYEVTTIRETLCFFRGLGRKKRKEFVERGDLVALGSSLKEKKSLRVPYINKKRQLILSFESCFYHGDMFLIRKLEKLE